jgi:negative regulator of sigma E activity
VEAQIEEWFSKRTQRALATSVKLAVADTVLELSGK